MITNKQLDSIVKIIEINEEYVVYDYRGKENQILITKELIEKLNSAINKFNENSLDSKEILKFVLRDAFELNESDLVLSKNGNIFIKLFNKVRRNSLQEQDRGTIASRYEGFEEEELESFYEEFFLDGTQKTFFLKVAKEFIKRYFLEQKISNTLYEKNVFGYIQAIVYEKLVAMYDNSDGFFNGFAGYMFRIHFKETFEYIADLILDEIANSNTYVMEFLNYYSSDVIVIKSVRYRVPNIEAESGLRWTGVSMLSIAKIYSKSRALIEEIVKESELLRKEIHALYIDDVSPLEYQTICVKERQELENEQADIMKKLNRYTDSLDYSKSEEEKTTLKLKIKEIKEILVEIREDRQNLAKKMVKQNIIRQYSELQKRLDSLTRQLKREKRLITQNRDAYISMRDSLVKALISKKQTIS